MVDLQKYVSVDCYVSGEKNLFLNDEARCRDCPGKNCAYICPAGVFEVNDNILVFHRDRVCLECGACRLACDNVVFDYPEAGLGLINHFG